MLAQLIIHINMKKLSKLYKQILTEELTYRYADTTGPEDDEYEVGMVKEGASPIVAYHGTKNKIDTFSDEFVGGKEATDQEGPGIYFTTKAEEALRYATPNGFVYKVELTPRKTLSDKMGFDFDYLTGPITKLIKMLPNWKAIANSYDEGLEEFVYMMTSMGQSEKEVFINLYYQYFRENAILFVRGMVKLGYDALYLPSKDGGAHIAVYNPNIINVVDVKQL